VNAATRGRGEENAPLPVEEALPALKAALAAHGAAVLQAPPGAGKTTRVPLALLGEAWLAGKKIVMLEPRRLAARGAAHRMAQTLGERVGETVGYRMRLDTKVGSKTRIEVVTEGILVRQLQRDPALEASGLLVFDEFHERSLDADLGLALSLEAKRALRDDLRLLVMSATLEGGPVAALLGEAPILTSEGRLFPVETRWVDPSGWRSIEDAVAAIVRRALRDDEGDILVFLPGGREIRRVAERLADLDDVMPLYGDLPQAAQDAALRPSPPGRRKIVLATSIAETSLTIEGVRVVVDSGLSRVSRFDPGTGMARLETVKTSRAAADQRRGRGGRTAPGICYRLWTELDHRLRPAFLPPEIREADLSPLALDLAQWGARAEELSWLDPPPAAALAQAQALLRELGALDAAGRITKHGKDIAAFGAHPRLAHMMVASRSALACEVAGFLSSREATRGRETDLRHLLEKAGREATQQARMWKRQLKIADEPHPTEGAGAVLALAYPERIARRRAGGGGRFRLAQGSGAFVAPEDPLAAAEFLAVAALDGTRAEARIFLAAPLTRAEIDEAFGERLVDEVEVAWDARAEAVVARRKTRLGELVLDEAPLPEPPRDRALPAFLDGLRQMGAAALPWTDELRQLQARAAQLRRHGVDLPDLSDEALVEAIAPWLDGIFRKAQLARLDLGAILRDLLGWDGKKRLDALAPERLDVPSGRSIALDYSGERPVLAVKLQEMFGAVATPTIASGKIPVVLHLLSPAGRPLAVTQDLPHFWKNTYPAVRGEMRGRYPKHPWPEDPMAAPPTHRAKPRA
jgi:ATP-dependent helicase HrpB